MDRPHSRPDWEFAYCEDYFLPEGLLRLGPMQRDVTGAYLCVTTRDGEVIDEGPMRREEGEWRSYPRDLKDPRLLGALVFVIAAGAHWVNA